jgi:hypothetical protein
MSPFFIQESGQPLDDARGAQIVTSDLGDDLLDLLAVDLILLQLQVHGFGIEQDRAQRLIESCAIEADMTPAVAVRFKWATCRIRLRESISAS